MKKLIYPLIFIFLNFVWIFVNAPSSCAPNPVSVTITEPANGDTVGVNLVTFSVSFNNVTDDPPNATLTINSVPIAGNGDVTIKGQVVTITKFTLNFLGASFVAWNLPIGTLQFQVNLTTSTGETASATSVFTVDPTIGIYFGDGKDRDLTVSVPNTTVNSYSVLTVNANTGVMTLTVSDSSFFRPNDEVMIIQMQGTNAGQYEFRKIASITDTTITLTSGLVYSYVAAPYPNKVNVIRVPNYANVTITGSGSIIAKPWDGNSGGVIVFRVNGTLNINGGGIMANGVGYRGGSSVGACYSSTYSYSGESYTGLGIQNKLANGGGGGGTYISNGGGGASFGTAGTAGTYNCTSYKYPGVAGAVYGTTTLASLFLGSGGGGGGDGYLSGWCKTSADKGYGGNGGGIVRIYAFKLVANALISSNGTEGGYGWLTNSGSWIPGGGGGGGSGGSIYISSKDIVAPAKNITALGGKGGQCTKGTYGGCYVNLPIGGDGGNGRIRIDYQTINDVEFPNAGQGDNSVNIANPPAFGGGLPSGN